MSGSLRVRRLLRSQPADPQPGLEMGTAIGSVPLPNPVMTASGTAGHGAELGAYLDLADLGAIVVKSLHADPYKGNPAPRLHETAAPGSMLNSVGLQGPGIEAWLEHDLPLLIAKGARVVASIWGFTVDDYARAAALLAQAPPEVVAVEVNLSCPNVEARRRVFAHSPTATADAIDATAAAGRPRWAKLSPNVTDITEIAGAALATGAEALTLINTVMGMAIDPETRRPRLGSGANGGGLSGPAIHPVAVRAVFDCHAAYPDAPIIGVGGITTGADAIELLMAGASAVQVGTATFADPRAPARVLAEMSRWLADHHVPRLTELIGAAHGR